MNTNAEIITIGDEILIGQVIDTNSAWLAQQLNMLGINVCQMTSISDNSEHIVTALDQAELRADLILVTGGLGPTKDDLTKQTIATYFKAQLQRNEAVLQHIRKLFEPRGIKVNALNEAQADLPDNCTILPNSCGTAAGMWFEKNGKVFVFMPGVPFEMKAIVNEELIPKLQQRFQTPAIVHKTLVLQGVAESILAQHIAEWEGQLSSNIKLAYLPAPGIIRLRLTAKGDAESVLEHSINKEVNKLKPLIHEWFFSDIDETLEVTIGKLLKNNNKTIGTAESCTGGRIASLITSVPGSSAYFKGSVIAYSNEIKTNILGVLPDMLSKHGAVSQPVVETMAQNTIKLIGCDYAIATSGIAGPDGGTPEKPVGTVWIAVASKQQVWAKKFSFGEDNRERNIQKSALSAINQLSKLILSEIEKNANNS
jgi:nicotinamide-nucleotide amidase